MSYRPRAEPSTDGLRGIGAYELFNGETSRMTANTTTVGSEPSTSAIGQEASMWPLLTQRRYKATLVWRKTNKDTCLV